MGVAGNVDRVKFACLGYSQLHATHAPACHLNDPLMINVAHVLGVTLYTTHIKVERSCHVKARNSGYSGLGAGDAAGNVTVHTSGARYGTIT